jgi:hypothetical protein
LKPGGRLVIVEPFHNNFLSRVLPLSFREASALVEKAGFLVDVRRELHFWPIRIPLSLFDWPPMLTTVGYHIGHVVMRLGAGLPGLGDYKGIAATKLSRSKAQTV